MHAVGWHFRLMHKIGRHFRHLLQWLVTNSPLYMYQSGVGLLSIGDEAMPMCCPGRPRVCCLHPRYNVRSASLDGLFVLVGWFLHAV